MHKIDRRWTDDEDNKLKEMLRNGYSFGEIARQLQFRSRNSVIGRANRMGISGNPVQYFWNKETLSRLEQLYHSPLGYSRAEMAAALGCGTSNISNGIAMLRKAKNLPPKPSPTRFQVGHKRNGASYLVRKPSVGVLRQAATTLPKDKIIDPVPLVALTATSCRWPVDSDDGPMLYCGSEAWPDRPYCGRHCRVAYRAT